MEDIQDCMDRELEALKNIDKELKSLKHYYSEERMDEIA